MDDKDVYQNTGSLNPAIGRAAATKPTLIFFCTLAICIRPDAYINYEDSNEVPDANIFLLHWGGNSESDTIIILDAQSDSNGYYYLEFEGIPHGWYWVKAEKDGYNPSIMRLIDAGSSQARTLYLNP